MEEHLTRILKHLKGFALTRPVAFGAPACALIGALAGVAMRTGPQDGPYTPEMAMVGPTVEATAEPIAWPAGKVPDYVIGTDFLRATEPPPAIQLASYETDYEPPPAPDLPPYETPRHGPAEPPPDPGAPRWASERGDILDVSLPEDGARRPIPMVLADAADDAASTGMTTR